MGLADKELRLKVGREFARRSIDTTFMDIYCNKGVVRLGGTVRALRGGPTNMQDYLQTVIEVIRRFPEVREVINEMVVAK